MTEGTVKVFNSLKNFGFISGEDGKDYFVHSSGLEEGVNITDGDKVSFKIVKGDKGTKAVNVRLVGSEGAETEKVIRIILNLNDDTAKEFDESAEGYAKTFSGISNSKLRQFYDYVKDIKEFDKVKLYLLKPKLAYAIGKETNNNKKECLIKFQKMMNLLIINCDCEENFKHLKDFFEAIVAYHKVYSKGD